MAHRKYRLLFSSSRRRRKPGPKGPSGQLIAAIVEMKHRNPKFGCVRIAQQINHAFGIKIDKDVVRRVLAIHFRPQPGAESGRIEARSGLRMMPTFPRSSLSFRTAGFPQYGWKVGFPSGAFLDRRQLKPAPGIRCPSSSLHPPFVHLGVNAVIPHCVGPQTRLRTAMEGYYSSTPRGPRSGSGYSVPIRHHLCDPIRPPRGHIAISPQGGLYAMPSLCGSA